MKKFILVVLIGFFGLSSFAQTPIPKKEPKITIDSQFYKNASGVVVAFFKQAKINNYYVDEKLDQKPTLNFQVREMSVDQVKDLLSKIYKIKIETNDKKDFYFVLLDEKK